MMPLCARRSRSEGKISSSIAYIRPRVSCAINRPVDVLRNYSARCSSDREEVPHASRQRGDCGSAHLTRAVKVSLNFQIIGVHRTLKPGCCGLGNQDLSGNHRGVLKPTCVAKRPGAKLNLSIVCDCDDVVSSIEVWNISKRTSCNAG